MKVIALQILLLAPAVCLTTGSQDVGYVLANLQWQYSEPWSYWLVRLVAMPVLLVLLIKQRATCR